MGGGVTQVWTRCGALPCLPQAPIVHGAAKHINVKEQGGFCFFHALLEYCTPNAPAHLVQSPHVGSQLLLKIQDCIHLQHPQHVCARGAVGQQAQSTSLMRK